MKMYFKNIGYFFKETKLVLGLNLVSNLLSIFSTGLIFLILAAIISSWWISEEVVEMIQQEAEISVYFNENIRNADVVKLVEEITTIEGVLDVKVIGEGEAYNRMVEILGKEAQVLSFFDDNPFSPFIEVRIDLNRIDLILGKLESVAGIDYIRDNKQVLDRMNSIANVLKWSGYVLVIAVGITTLVIVSHIIRLGIYNNREQINTLRLLGAPEFFIAFPYLMVGLLLTLGGGLLAIILITFILKYFYSFVTGPIPFIPIPSIDNVLFNLISLIMPLGIILGIVGSLIGLSSSRSE